MEPTNRPNWLGQTREIAMTTKEAEFEVVEYRALAKGESLQGFLSLRLPSGMVIRDLSYHERSDGARWISMPARRYKKADGTAAYTPIIDFASKEARNRFQELARAALDSYLASAGEEMGDSFERGAHR
jgi:hypothetical protein